jgi:hypothetical protein
MSGAAFLDPFAGVGTSILAAEHAGVPGYGIEAQPLIKRIAEAKLLWYTSTIDFYDMAQAVSQRAKTTKGASVYPRLIYECFDEEAVRDLDSLRCALETTVQPQS